MISNPIDQTAVFSLTDFRAGIATNPASAEDGPLSVARGVDIRHAAGVTLARRLETLADTLIDTEIVRILALADTPDTIAPYLLVFTRGGKIFRLKTNGTGLAEVYADTDGLIVNAVRYNDRIFWATGVHLSNIAISDVGAATWTANEVNTLGHEQRTFANGSSRHTMVVTGGRLFVGDGDRIAMVDDIFDVFDSGMIRLESDETVVGMTFGGSFLSVYTRNAGVAESSRKYLWDTVGETLIGRVNLDRLPVRQVANRLGTDYLLAGKDDSLGLYASEGYTVRQVRPFDSTLHAGDFAREASMADSRDGILFSGGQDGSIHSYGRRAESDPDGYAESYRTATDSDLASVSALATLGDELYAGVKYSDASTTYAIEVRDDGKYHSSGVIETADISVGSLLDMKIFESLRVVTDIPAGTSIAVAASMDGGEFTDIRTLASTGSGVTDITVNEWTADREFRLVRLRFTLATTDANVTPTLIGFRLSTSISAR